MSAICLLIGDQLGSLTCGGGAHAEKPGQLAINLETLMQISPSLENLWSINQSILYPLPWWTACCSSYHSAYIEDQEIECALNWISIQLTWQLPVKKCAEFHSLLRSPLNHCSLWTRSYVWSHLNDLFERWFVRSQLSSFEASYFWTTPHNESKLGSFT